MQRIEQSIEINVPVRMAYNQLTQFEEYPRFMEDVQAVHQLDDTHLHWHAKAGQRDMEWDAEITEQVPDRCIAWRNTSGPRYQGKIELRPTEPERTRVTLTVDCEPAEQPLARPDADAKTAIAQRTEHDLARFKKFIEKLGSETGEWRGTVHGARAFPSPDSVIDDTSGTLIGKEVGQTETERRDAARSNDSPHLRQTYPAGQPHSFPSAHRAADEIPRTSGSVSGYGSNMAAGMMRDRWGTGFGRIAGRPLWMPNLLQAWEEPFRILRKMTENVDEFIDRAIGRPVFDTSRNPPVAPSAWMPPIEVAQREGKFIVCAELPGVKREDVTVDVLNGKLTIEGHRRQEPLHAANEYRRSERRYGHFYRSVALPPGADTEGISATMRDGMLEITVPLSRPDQQSRRVDISS